jgi:uncharacterized protein (TIGR02996 family)
MTRDDILRSVLLAPEDDAPRLVYADWLEEYGDEHDAVRAEFIRAQVAGEALACGQCKMAMGGGQRTNGPCRCLPEGRKRRAQARELKINLQNWWRWIPTDTFAEFVASTGSVVGAVADLDGSGSVADYAVAVRFRRGFVAEVETYESVFLACAARLFAAHPVTRVSLREKIAIDGSGWSRQPSGPKRSAGLSWLRPRRLTTEQVQAAQLHTDIFSRLPGIEPHCNWKDFKDPYGDLSRACVAYGREKAGQPV